MEASKKSKICDFGGVKVQNLRFSLWVADTGATCDSIAHKQGMCILVKGQGKDKITMAQGDGSHVLVLGNIPGDLVTRHGEPKGTVTLNGVSHVPNANFNLCSLTKK